MQNITMRALYHKSLEIAYMLRKKGLRPGDRAVIFSMQDYGTTYAILGCMMQVSHSPSSHRHWTKEK